MLVFLTILIFILYILFVLMFHRIREFDNRIDQIFNESIANQGEIEANAARSQDNYKLIAEIYSELDKYKNEIGKLKNDNKAKK